MSDRTSKNRKKRKGHSLYRYIPVESKGTESRQARVTVVAYDNEKLVQEEIADVRQLQDFKGKYPVLWVQIIGLEDPEWNQKIADFCRLHHLALDAVLNIQQRSRLEQYGDENLLIAHYIDLQETLATIQISLFISRDFLVTFQQGDADVLGSVRERLEKRHGNIRASGTDYLAGAILETVLGSYFPCLENYGEKLETLEDQIIDSPSRTVVAEIHHVKRDLLAIRRAVWPLREAINTLIRDSSAFFAPEALIHMRDCYSTSVQIIDFLETYRELASDLMDMYLSSVSNRMNEVMKVLAVITTIFVPSGLIASIYGMNFHSEKSPWNMPELNWYFGYPMALGLMLLVSVTIIIILKFKGWLGDKPNFGGR
jgi:magnesium transporter